MLPRISAMRKDFSVTAMDNNLKEENEDNLETPIHLQNLGYIPPRGARSQISRSFLIKQNV
jgi:hypothetical protein